jgi:hypothetical protein
VNTAPTPPPTSSAAQAPQRLAADRVDGFTPVAGVLGSRTPTTSSSTPAHRGTTATQNTARKSLAHSSISAVASSGPRKAPTVSSDCRSPKAAPRMAGRRDVGQQRVARGAADALADAVDEARRHHQADAGGQRKHRLGQGAQA